MLNQQLRQRSEMLKKLKSKKHITEEDEILIKKIEMWFENFFDAE